MLIIGSCFILTEMIDDNDEQVRASIRAQANVDAQAFLSQMLEAEDSSGVPEPPVIDVSETSSEPIKLDFIGFGTQGSSARRGR